MEEANAEHRLRQRVESFLRQNLPQIEMHGGESTIKSLDPESGEVTLVLSGACSGCGLSPMTVNAIQRRLPRDVEGVESVEVFADELSASASSDEDNEIDERDAPF